MKPVIVTYKKQGETPLQALERVRKEEGISPEIPMTYAGRLDPLAEGKLIILTGEECKNKSKYTDLSKTYEVDILFGIETDTYDPLGIVTKVDMKKTSEITLAEVENAFQKYIGIVSQTYPAYSSKTINGKALHEHARTGNIAEIDRPKRLVTISSITINQFKIEPLETVVNNIRPRIAEVKGEFRFNEINASWEKVLQLQNTTSDYVKAFAVATVTVHCSSGTYMRTLAHDVGKDIGSCAIAYLIKRTKVGDF